MLPAGPRLISSDSEISASFTSIYLLYLFRPLTPLNIFKGVDVIGGLKIGQ